MRLKEQGEIILGVQEIMIPERPGHGSKKIRSRSRPARAADSNFDPGVSMFLRARKRLSELGEGYETKGRSEVFPDPPVGAHRKNGFCPNKK